MIGIVDYGLGNIQAFLTMYKRLGLEAIRVRSHAELAGVSRLVLPGVGAFDHAMECLSRSGLRSPIEELVLGQRMPVLGVCVGMQILAERSDEGQLPGLAWIPGQVRAFSSNAATRGLSLPHMGWNDLQVNATCRLFGGFDEQPRFYFLHSYYFECRESEHVAATAHYGTDFCCVVAAGNIYGVQCHPEKSHHFGARLLENFARI